MAALALPMMAQNAKADLDIFGNFRIGAVAQKTLQVKKVQVNTLRGDVPSGYASVTLAAGDVWQDGSGYQMLIDADATAYGTIIPETGGLTSYGDASAATYAEFEYKIPDNADGSLTTTNIVLDDAVTILIPAGVYDWCITNPTPGDRVWIASSNGNVGGRADDFEFISGVSYVFSVSIGGSNDRVDLEIEDPTAPIVPENVTVDPAATTADVAWENDHDPFFNLRYRVYNPNAAYTLHWGAEDSEDLSDWYLYDADGDGYGWGISSYDAAPEGSNIFWSFSYYSYEAFDPDNYLITPELTMGGTLTFWAACYSSYWPDNFAVYLIPDIEDETTWVELMPETAGVENGEYYTIDLSAYEGMARIGFRHFDSYNQYYLFLDDITYNAPGEEVAEWIYVEGVEGNNYTIEGLDPETTYEVQVQGVNADGRVSNWTESTLFTTLEEGETPEDPHMTGYWVVTILADGTEEFLELQEGTNGDFVNLVDVIYPTYEHTGNFYFMINGVAYGAEADATLAVLGDADQNPLTEGTNTYYVDNGYSYVLGIHFIMDENTGDLVGYSAYVARGGAVDVNEMNAGKTVASERYFNVAGQEMAQPNGVTIKVITYTDGTTSTVKVVK